MKSTSLAPRSARYVNWLTSVLVIVVLLGAFAAMIDWYFSLPVVYVSQATKKCVRVESIPMTKKYTCADLVNNTDINYTTVWVK